MKAIKAALKRGLRVTTNTTLFDDANPERVREFFDEMMGLGVEGMMISPGYSYQKAPDQQHFLKRSRDDRVVFRSSGQSQAGLAVQSVAIVSRIPYGQAALSNARHGGTRRTTSSGGSAPVTCSRKAMPQASES